MLKPIGDRVLVKVGNKKDKTDGGLILTEKYSEKPTFGVVVALGDGIVTPNGQKVDFEVMVGDKVIFTKFSGIEVNGEEGEKYLLMHEKEILGILL